MTNNISIISTAIEVMAEPVRFTILSMIGSKGELRAKDLLEDLNVTQPTLSHHMNTLLEADLIISRKEGRCVWYSVNEKTVLRVADYIRSLTSENASVSVSRTTSSVSRIKTSVRKPAVQVRKTEVDQEPAAVISDNKDSKVKSKEKDKVKDKDKDKKKKKKDKAKKKKK